MNEALKKSSHIILAVVMLSGIFALGGCGLFRYDLGRPPRPPVYIYSECGAWVYRTHDREREPILDDYGGQVIVLVSVRDEYLYRVVDERSFLVIPTEVDGYRVVQLGDLRGRMFFTPRRFHDGGGINIEIVNRIVIPAGIFAEETFWWNLSLTNNVEMLARKPNFSMRALWGWPPTENAILIVPDGSRELYFEYSSTLRHHNVELPGVIIGIVVIEKSEIDNITQNTK